MNTKFFVIAASTAALGTAILSAPAQAQLATPATPINVEVSVPEVLALKTVSKAFFTIAPTDLNPGAVGGVFVDTNSGTAGIDPATGQAGTGVTTASPFAVNGPTLNKTLNNVYAVWSNSPRAAGVNVTFGGSGTLAAVAPAAGNVTYGTLAGNNQTALVPQGLVTPTIVGNVTIPFDVTAATKAGSFAGQISVTVAAP